jgi:hypothetical protein
MNFLSAPNGSVIHRTSYSVGTRFSSTAVNWPVLEPKYLRIIFFILYNEPTNAQLIDKLSHSPYMFRHQCVILREFVVSTVPSYTSMSKAVFGNII